MSKVKKKNNKKFRSRLGSKIFKTVNLRFKFFYKALEGTMGDSNKNKYYYPELRRMNKIMRKFYKTPQLQLKATDNLIPFNFETEDGVVISGMKYITDPNSKKWVVSLHWFAGHKYWALYEARPFIELGYNILVFDFRNHGESESTEYVTMGASEVKDFRAAMKWLHENHKPETIGLVGMSMGGFTMQYGIVKYNEEFSKYNIKWAISDSYYGSIKTLLVHTRNVWLKNLVSYKRVGKSINRIIKNQIQDTDLDWNDLDVFKYYESDLKMIFPMFFLHCRNDNVTPFDDSMRLFVKRTIHSRDDEILIYDYSSHCLSLKHHYYQTVYRWLVFENKIMKDDEATERALKNLGINSEIIDNNFLEKYEVNTFYVNSTKNRKKGK
ncbi:alpha/beta hydrolase [Mesoplasma florum]|uniref:alpha/beta hydrolase family protein n=1 Tax=Mesoplasma florum TaxID=2151 RepID=UPI000D03FD93|nr:alpha/beta fold hydrolase [Mesoplasma florum]AVN63866.1 alpha/beta hydrolase [Mesoplasma florum]